MNPLNHNEKYTYDFLKDKIKLGKKKEITLPGTNQKTYYIPITTNLAGSVQFTTPYCKTWGISRNQQNPKKLGMKLLTIPINDEPESFNEMESFKSLMEILSNILIDKLVSIHTLLDKNESQIRNGFKKFISDDAYPGLSVKFLTKQNELGHEIFTDLRIYDSDAVTKLFSPSCEDHSIIEDTLLSGRFGQFYSQCVCSVDKIWIIQNNFFPTITVKQIVKQVIENKFNPDVCFFTKKRKMVEDEPELEPELDHVVYDDDEQEDEQEDEQDIHQPHGHDEHDIEEQEQKEEEEEDMVKPIVETKVPPIVNITTKDEKKTKKSKK